MKHVTLGIRILLAVVAFGVFMVLLTSFAFADVRGRSEGSRRIPTLTRVLTTLEEKAPEQANSPEAVADALANEPENNSDNNENGNNGGTTAGNGGNGGNSSPGGLVKAGNVVSNSTASSAINTVIFRISLR